MAQKLGWYAQQLETSQAASRRVSSVEAGRLLQPVSLISGDNWQAQREVERLSRELVASQVCISRPHQLAAPSLQHFFHGGYSPVL
jgi:hypothetical protein